MLPGVSPNSGDPTSSPADDTPTTATTTTTAADLTSTSGFSEDEKTKTDDGGRNSGGNRWPRQETLYLLKIRSDMDAAFRDSSLKGPLWDEVSRKLAELGFLRSAKKCKEKFENVYKYHKRIKEGRSSKADGKTYKFFEQLEALEATGGNNQPLVSLPLPLPPPLPLIPKLSMPSVAVTVTVATPVSTTAVDPISVAAPDARVMDVDNSGRYPFSQLSMSSSSSTSSDDEPVEKRRNRKRKWKEFFGRLMKEVVEKQEEMQSKFLETLERRERDRVARVEAWRMQEMAKMKREHELLAQERSMVAARDAAVITFLQKIAEQNPDSAIPQMPAVQLLQLQQQLPSHPPAPTQTPLLQLTSIQQQPQPQPPPPALAAPVPVPVPIPVPTSVPTHAPSQPAVKNLDTTTGENLQQPSPSRWPKAEINALIQIRTGLDTKYQETGLKGPLWEEVSAAMRNLGYNRNAKRCKEKWENINKYYKKVKESSKKRPEDSKTCPYFHQLDAIYREKASGSTNPELVMKPETQMAPIMARPEQQWPLPAVIQQMQKQQQQQQQQQKQQQQSKSTEDHQNADLNEDDYDDEDEDEDEDEEEGGDYEIVANKTSSMASAE